MSYQQSTYDLCWSVIQGLLAQCPWHACGYSLASYSNLRHLATRVSEEYIVCRRDHPLAYVKTLSDYAAIMLQYLENHKWK